MNIRSDIRFVGVVEIISEKNDRDIILSQISKFLRESVPYYDWVGFYIMDERKNELVLGPYSGAHTDHTCIPVGKGVCGQVAQNKQTMIVQDVSKMENYLSCSIDVQSEIVVPIMKNGKFVAELDIDSHSSAPFTDADSNLLEAICAELSKIF